MGKGKGKGTVSAKDLIGGEPDPYGCTGFYVVTDYSYPPYWQPRRYGVECGCAKCKAVWEEPKEADKM